MRVKKLEVKRDKILKKFERIKKKAISTKQTNFFQKKLKDFGEKRQTTKYFRKF